MDRFLKAKEGPGADLWSMPQVEVYGPIGIRIAPTNRTIEPDGTPGQPLMAYGYYPTLGDLVKIAGLYQDRGRHGGQQILDPAGLDRLLGQGGTLGLPTGEHSAAGETRYFMGFWHAAFRAAKGCSVTLPQMDGWGGNYVVLMPNGMTGIRLAKDWDGGPAVSDTSGMAAVADRLTSFCP